MEGHGRAHGLVLAGLIALSGGTAARLKKPAGDRFRVRRRVFRKGFDDLFRKTLEARMDDLTRIKGIGPAAAKRLAQAGIDSFETLAHDGIAGQHGVKVEWISEAAELLHAAANENTEGKPPRPDEQGGSAEARPIPADSGPGDPQQDTPRGSSGTAREASSTGSGTTAEMPSVGTQSGSPNPPSDTAPESVGVGDAPNAGVPDAPAGEGGLDFFFVDGWPVKGEEFRRRWPRTAAALAAYAEPHMGQSLVHGPRTIRIAAKRDGFRRAGLSHPKSPVDHLVETFTPDQVEQLLGEPGLRVEFV